MLFLIPILVIASVQALVILASGGVVLAVEIGARVYDWYQ
jgi:hypothetical protein